MMNVSRPAANEWAQRLLHIGLVVQGRVAGLLAERAEDPLWLAHAVEETGGDRIYRLDREVETVLERELHAWPEACGPVMVVAEGMGEDGRMRIGDLDAPVRWRVIVDPVDGTRMLMYDKRSAWFLAAVAPDRGEETRLSDSIASVLVELPISRQNRADAFVVTADGETRGVRVEAAADGVADPDRGEWFTPRPSRATELTDGFVTVFAGFPGTRRLAADLMERIAEHTGGTGGIPQFFDDQYLSTGGQMVQLMTGRDLCCIDLRPLFNRILARSGSAACLAAHPYDAAGLLALRQSGVLVTDGFGRELDAPFDVSTGVHWCGYANDSIRRVVEPVVQGWLADQGVHE